MPRKLKYKNVDLNEQKKKLIKNYENNSSENLIAQYYTSTWESDCNWLIKPFWFLYPLSCIILEIFQIKMIYRTEIKQTFRLNINRRDETN